MATTTALPSHLAAHKESDDSSTMRTRSLSSSQVSNYIGGANGLDELTCILKVDFGDPLTGHFASRCNSIWFVSTISLVSIDIERTQHVAAMGLVLVEFRSFVRPAEKCDLLSPQELPLEQGTRRRQDPSSVGSSFP